MFGTLNSETNEWNGAIREIIDGKADVILADLGINKDRFEAIDFTFPYDKEEYIFNL